MKIDTDQEGAPKHAPSVLSKPYEDMAQKPSATGVEVFRNRKGRVILDKEAQLYTVWIDEGGGSERSVMETREQRLAEMWLKDC